METCNQCKRLRHPALTLNGPGMAMEDSGGMVNRNIRLWLCADCAIRLGAEIYTVSGRGRGFKDAMRNRPGR